MSQRKKSNFSTTDKECFQGRGGLAYCSLYQSGTGTVFRAFIFWQPTDTTL